MAHRQGGCGALRSLAGGSNSSVMLRTSMGEPSHCNPIIRALDPQPDPDLLLRAGVPARRLLPGRQRQCPRSHHHRLRRRRRQRDQSHAAVLFPGHRDLRGLGLLPALTLQEPDHVAPAAQRAQRIRRVHALSAPHRRPSRRDARRRDGRLSADRTPRLHDHERVQVLACVAPSPALRMASPASSAAHFSRGTVTSPAHFRTAWPAPEPRSVLVVSVSLVPRPGSLLSSPRP